MASYSSLERLPDLVLESVCEYLAAAESRRRSLFAFSLTSKRCCSMTDRTRFTRIRLQVVDGKELRQRLARCNKVLGERTILVREMKIRGCMRLENEGSVPPHEVSSLGEPSFEEATRTYKEEDDDFFTVAPQTYFIGSSPGISSEHKLKRSQEWKPLARFISTCPGLKHLVWASEDQFPRCILDVLHDQLRSTRLHILTFSLRSQYQREDQFHDVDEDKYALSTSPSLSSICAPTTYIDIKGSLGLNEDASCQMAATLAPNLQSVGMWYQLSRCSRATSCPPTLWPGFFKVEDRPKGLKGSITKLTLRGNSTTGIGRRLQRWTEYTDFSKLRCLELFDSVGPDALQILADMATDGEFKSLKELTFNTLGSNQNFDDEMVTDNLFSALPPLEALHIIANRKPAKITLALGHQGLSLKRLNHPLLISESTLSELRRSFPNLEDLSVVFRRSQGDEQEVRQYLALGALPRLRQLTLRIDGDFSEVPDWYTVEGDSFTNEQNQQIGAALIDSAIDAQLAQSIFSTILAASRKVRLGLIPSFECLKLRFENQDVMYGSFGNQNVMYGDFGCLQQWVARSWTCERVRADVDSEEAFVQEYSTEHEREAMRQRYIDSTGDSYYSDGSWDETFPNRKEPYRPAWETLWPNAVGKGSKFMDGFNSEVTTDWMDEWHSFPLWTGWSDEQRDPTLTSATLVG